MGSTTIPALPAAPTETAATSEQYNKLRDGNITDRYARNSSGVVTDGVHNCGSPASGRIKNLYMTGDIIQGGNVLITDSLVQTGTGIKSSKMTDDFPAFLAVNAPLDQKFKIVADSTDPLVMIIDGQSYSLETEVQSNSLALAPAANNTCLVNEPTASRLVFTKTIGEYGNFINIDSIGSELTSLDGTVQAFELNNGSATEIFYGYLDTANGEITPYKRGVGGTSRITFANNDTITLLKAHYIFLDDDLTTVDTTTTYPSAGPNAPSGPSTGDYWFDTTIQSWRRYSGSTWEQLGRIFLGIAITNSTNCFAVNIYDLEKVWDSEYEIDKINVISNTEIEISNLTTSVAGEKIKMPFSYVVDISSDLESGVIEAADTWYYLYVNSSGEFYLSDVEPRLREKKKGFYHKNHYWRCLYCVYNNSSSNFSKIYYDPYFKSYRISTESGDGVNIVSGSLSTSYTNFSAVSPPIATTHYITTAISIKPTAATDTRDFYAFIKSISNTKNAFQIVEQKTIDGRTVTASSLFTNSQINENEINFIENNLFQLKWASTGNIALQRYYVNLLGFKIIH